MTGTRGRARCDDALELAGAAPGCREVPPAHKAAPAASTEARYRQALLDILNVAADVAEARRFAHVTLARELLIQAREKENEQER